MRLLPCLLAAAVFVSASVDDAYGKHRRCRQARRHCSFAKSCSSCQPGAALGCGSTQGICANQPVPAGYVRTGYYTDFNCGSGTNTAMYIKSIGGCPAGTSIGCCANQPVPSGWVRTGYFTDFNCGSGLNTAMYIKCLAGYSVGTVIGCCANQPVPSGWTRTGYYTDFNCGSGTNTAMYIRKL